MRRFLLGLLAVTFLASPLTAADSFVYVIDGRCITNGAPVNNKAIKAKYSGSYFWFSIDGKAYLVRDPDVLSAMKPIYAPVFDMGFDFPIGEQFEVMVKQLSVLKEQQRPGLTDAQRLALKFEQNRLSTRQNELAKRANAAAKRANEYSARVDEMNRKIEGQLHDLGVQLIASGVAVRAQ